MKMKQKKLKIFVLLMSLMFFFGVVGNIIIMNTVEKPSEKNTTEFKATVNNIEMRELGTGENYIINTYEYDDKISIFNIKKIVDMNDINKLQTGQAIFFRVENAWLDQF